MLELRPLFGMGLEGDTTVVAVDTYLAIDVSSCVAVVEAVVGRRWRDS